MPWDFVAGQPVCSVAAIQRTRTVLNQDPRVVHVIDNRNPQAYSLVGELANDGPCDVVSLQHDFDLYPDEWGARILDFTRICKKPLVTTFHTLPQQPETLPRMLVQKLAATSQGVVVMAEGAVQLLKEVYGVSGPAVQVIPHGVPEVAFQRDERLKGRLGQEGKKVICTFGLLSRSKGIEYMIRAMPHIVAVCPEAVYWIVGVTHPQVKRQEGEIYREELMDLVESLGVSKHVRFINKISGDCGATGSLASGGYICDPLRG